MVIQKHLSIIVNQYTVKYLFKLKTIIYSIYSKEKEKLNVLNLYTNDR